MQCIRVERFGDINLAYVIHSHRHYKRQTSHNYYNLFRAILVDWRDSVARSVELLQELEPHLHGHILSDHNSDNSLAVCILS